MPLLNFESKQEKYVFFGVALILLVVIGILIYPNIRMNMGDKLTSSAITHDKDVKLESAKTPKEYYQMFQCSCCGQPIDAGCCGMAKQRKGYVDKLLLDGLEENEVAYEMVKKFGFDVLMDQSKEQEVRDYIKSKAPDNPPKIEIENPKYDFGTVSQSDGIVSTFFTIKNTGGSDLVIENMDTSCMCTSASIIYNGIEGPRFGMSMHGENPEDYELKIPSGESAQLKVYYDPMAHGI